MISFTTKDGRVTYIKCVAHNDYGKFEQPDPAAEERLLAMLQERPDTFINQPIIRD